jgi:protein gp37
VPIGHYAPFEEIVIHLDRMDQPLHWRKPRRIFVGSMCDLFHPDVADAVLDRILATVARCPQHSFLILTKRPERMLAYVATPLSNVWLGVTAENQSTADERIPILLQTPAARRFVSMEPMLERVNLISIPGDWLGAAEKYDALRGQSWYLTGGHIGISAGPKLDWVIAGPETGPGARPCDPDWIHQTIRECRDSGVPCFIKARERIGMPDAPQEWPDALEEKP